MSKRPKIFEDELRAKKVYTKIEKASNLPKNYNKKTNQGFKKPMIKNTPRGKEVVIKITGNSKNFQHWKAHLDYVTRKGELEIVADKDTKYQGLEDNKAFSKFFNNSGSAIPNDHENLKEKREVLNFVFSMKEQNTTPKDKLMEAVIKSVKEKYPNNPACFSFHGDTDNPHIHCDLKIQSLDGKRIDVKIADLQKLRKDYAKNLRDLGIEAYATRKYEKYDKDKNINLDTTVQDKNLTGAGENKIKNHHYEVVEFGKAKYKFDEKAKDSFYVKYKTTKDEIIDIWGEDLERVVKENDVKVGEFVKFKVTDKTPVEVQTKNLNNKTNKWTVYIKTALKNVWDCSILGRAEKDLKMVSDKENRKPIYSSKVVISELEKKTAEFIRMKKERVQNKD